MPPADALPLATAYARATAALAAELAPWVGPDKQVAREAFLAERARLEGPAGAARWAPYWPESKQSMPMAEVEALLRGHAAVALEGFALAAGPLTAAECRALRYRGRDDWPPVVEAEWARLIALGPSGITDQVGRDPFVAHAQIAGLGHDGLATLATRHAPGGALTRVAFERAAVEALGHSQFRTVRRNPGEVTQISEPAREAARTRLAALKPLAETAKARLTPAEQKAYEGVREQLRQRPLGKLALTELLVAGALTTGPVDLEGRTLLAALAALAAGPLTPSVKRRSLIEELVRELHDPTAISQGLAMTCAVAAVQMFMARQDPAEYVRVVTALAAPKGVASTRSGTPLLRHEAAEAFAAANPDKRSQASRLFQSAAMELGNGAWVYDAAGDRHLDETGTLKGTGLYQPGTSVVLQALTGRPVTTVTASAAGRPEPWSLRRLWRRLTGGDTPSLISRIEDSLARGVPVPVGVDWHEADAAGAVHVTHEILLTALDETTVTYLNPWGQEEHMPRSAFETRLNDASLIER